MKLESIFQFSIYSMTALAGAMLAYAEEIPFPSGVTVVLSGLALFFSGRKRPIRFPGLITNLLGLTALIFATFEFFGKSDDARLLAGAHFLVYITWIVLFQARDIRHYWWLCALSLLQVAIGPLLTLSSGWYGMLLLFYMLLAIWTLAVFALYQGACEFGAIPLAAKTRGGGVPAPAPGRQAAFRSRFARNRPSSVHNSIQQDSPGRWIVPRFVVGVLGLAVAGLALGLVMFLFVPRVWIGSGNRYQGEGQRGGPAVTGFSNEVLLGQLGQILESTDRVIQVGLFDHFSDEPISIEKFAQNEGFSAPLFRGNVLDVYSMGRWNSSQRSDRLTMMESWPREEGMIRQEYTLEAHGSEILFAMQPFELAALRQPYQPVSVGIDTDVLSARAEGRDPLVYVVYSYRPIPGQASVPLSGRGRMRQRRSRTFARTVASCRQLPPGLERLTGLAEKLTASEKLIGDDDLPFEQRMALTLEAHLRDSGQYAYTLNMAVDDPNSDPVEDFLFNRKRGHCEYFASALALMLRAVQIPSRLVTGFKGADAAGSEGRYEVQQRHAHAWVEAFVEGKWIVLDPTPADRDENVRNVAARAGFWSGARNSISSLWSTYVVSLSLSRQQQTLYDPLQGSVSSGWGSLREAWQQATSAAGWVREVFTSPEQLLTPLGTILCLLLLAGAIAVFVLMRRLLSRERRAPGGSFGRGALGRFFGWLAARLGGKPPDAARIVVAFYEQFQGLVRSAGLKPGPGQTQREFALHVEESLGERLMRSGLNRFPSELVEQFYHVRFGEGLLQPAETLEIERRLDRLKDSLKTG